jgi:hypothetical protein
MIQVVCQWPTPVILVTQKAEIRRISVQSQPEQIVPEKNSSQKKKKKITRKGLVEWLKWQVACPASMRL